MNPISNHESDEECDIDEDDDEDKKKIISSYSDGFVCIDNALLNTIPSVILIEIRRWHIHFHDQWLQLNLIYHQEREGLIRSCLPNYHHDFLETINQQFKRTRRTYKLYHPITNLYKQKLCDICGRLPVGYIYSAWDERRNEQRPWGKYNEKKRKLQRYGTKSKICFQCSIRYCCKVPKCSPTIKDKKIPPIGMDICLTCVMKDIKLNV